MLTKQENLENAIEQMDTSARLITLLIDCFGLDEDKLTEDQLQNIGLRIKEIRCVLRLVQKNIWDAYDLLDEMMQ